MGSNQESIIQALMGEDYDTVLEQTKDANDDFSRGARFYALCQDDRYAEAYELIEHRDVDSFSRAYCLYKLNRLQEAAAVLESAENDVKGLALKAQIAYRQEQAGKAAAMFEDPRLTETIAAEDLKVNILASKALGGVEVDDDGLETFEEYFNAAYGNIEAGNLLRAQVNLEKAKELVMNEEGEDGITDLAAIDVQLAYVAQLVGMADKAQKTYDSVFKDRNGDGATMAVLVNNFVSSQKTNKFDALRKYKLTLGEDLENNKLLRSQRLVIAANRALMYSGANQSAELKREIDNLQSSGEKGMAIYLEALTAGGGKATTELEQNKALSAIQQGVDQAFAGVLCQLLSKEVDAILGDKQTKPSESAIARVKDVLAKAPKALLYRPLPLAVQCFLDQGDVDAQEALIEDALQFHDNNGTMAEYLALASGFGRSLLASGEYHRASKYFKSIIERQRDNKTGLVGLIVAQAVMGSGDAEQLLSYIPDVDISSVNVDDVESNLRKDIGFEKRLSMSAAAKQNTKEAARRKRSTRRRGKLPKGVDPNSDPTKANIDPERWLPLRERSYYRKTKAEKRKEKLGLTRGGQGSTTGAGAPQQQSGGGKKKKGKKGRK
eukprot:Clim_evm37s227 gene=Clim_evmTU37s227